MSQPTNYVQVDEALDEIGRVLFGYEWERMPRSYLLSLRLGRGLGQLRLEKYKNGVLRIARRSYLPHGFAKQRLRARQMFLEVTNKLKEALENGQIEAIKFIPSTGARVPIKELGIFPH